MAANIRHRCPTPEKAPGPAKPHDPCTPVAGASAFEAAAEQRRQFFRLSICQLVAGGSYAGASYLIFHLECLEPYRDAASWFVDSQYRTVLGSTHAGKRDACYSFTAFVGVMTMRAVVQLSAYWLVASRADSKIKSKIRFTEQAWCLVYYGGAASWGSWLSRSQPYGWNAEQLWVGFPHYYIDPAVKRYYSTSFGYWVSQLVVIHLEERRKDHWQMFTHHIVTCALILGSFAYSYTRIGHLVLIMMDTVDVFSSLAKCTKYLRAPTIVTDAIFFMFLVSWVVSRHFSYMYEISYAAFPAVAYSRGRCAYFMLSPADPAQCFSLGIHNVFFVLTLASQAIISMWLVLIVKVVMRVSRGEGATDNRSDSED